MTARDGWRWWLNPHRFRHHLATSLVNEGVPLSVIQRVLDHGSIEMTARYSHLDNEIVKREMAGFHERVNIRGERIALPTGGPLEQAAWMKERIARAKQALANGYCGLPLVQLMPAPERVPELRELPHRQLVPPDPRAPVSSPTLRRCAGTPSRTKSLRRVELLEGDEAGRCSGSSSGWTRSTPMQPAGCRCGRPRCQARSQPRERALVSGRRVDALRGAATARSLSATERARRALAELDRRGQAITFRAVANQAGVSARFLYGHAELRGMIQQLRDEQPSSPSRQPRHPRGGEESLRARLRGTLEDNKRLRAENAQLREELALAHGQVRELKLARGHRSPR